MSVKKSTTNEASKAAFSISQCFKRSLNAGLTKDEIIILCALGRYPNHEDTVESLLDATSLSRWMLTNKKGGLRSLVDRGLVSVRSEKRRSAQVYAYSLNDKGWDILRLITAGA